MKKTNTQPDFFPEMNRRIERYEAPPLFAKLKADVESLTFATDLAASDAGNAVAWRPFQTASNNPAHETNTTSAHHIKTL